MRYIYLFNLSFIIIFTFNHSSAQEISREEELQIILNAKDLIRDFEDLLNELSNAETSPEERAFLIENSYLTGRNQIFYNPEIVVENDLDPSSNERFGNELDMSIKQYLNYFDLFYEKSISPSVDFADIKAVSEILQKEYTYLRVSYVRSLNGIHKEENTQYEPLKRVAEVRIDKIGNRWAPYIVGITYATDKPQNGIETVNHSEGIEPTPPRIPTVFSEESYQFITPKQSSKLKKGNRLYIRWAGPPGANIPLKLVLTNKKGNGVIIANNIMGETATWVIPKNISGGSYQINIYHNTDNQLVGKSKSFKIGGLSPVLTISLFLLPPIAYGLFSIASDSDF